MKATPQQQATLLDLQQTELKSGRLRHQIANHPTRETLRELKGRAEDLQRFVIALSTQIDDQQRELAKTENEIDKVRARRDIQQERLDSGKVGIRDMSAVEHEIQRIQERQDDLEAQLLDQMETLEADETRLEDAKRQVSILIEEGQKTQFQLNQELQDPAAELVELDQKRADLIAKLPEEVSREYARLLERQGPIVVLHLEDGMLLNSPVSVSHEELDDAMAAPQDELFFSEETGYLIARPGS